VMLALLALTASIAAGLMDMTLMMGGFCSSASLIQDMLYPLLTQSAPMIHDSEWQTSACFEWIWTWLGHRTALAIAFQTAPEKPNY